MIEKINELRDIEGKIHNLLGEFVRKVLWQDMNNTFPAAERQLSNRWDCLNVA